MGRTLRLAQDPNRRTVKPTPPDNYFALMDAALQELQLETAVERPPNSRTLKEISDKYGFTTCMARNRVRKLVRAGKMTQVRVGTATYYAVKDATRKVS